MSSNNGGFRVKPYFEIDDNSGHKNANALHEVTKNMNEGSSQVDVLFRPRISGWLTFHFDIGIMMIA